MCAVSLPVWPANASLSTLSGCHHRLIGRSRSGQLGPSIFDPLILCHTDTHTHMHRSDDCKSLRALPLRLSEKREAELVHICCFLDVYSTFDLFQSFIACRYLSGAHFRTCLFSFPLSRSLAMSIEMCVVLFEFNSIILASLVFRCKCDYIILKPVQLDTIYHSQVTATVVGCADESDLFE